MSNFVNINAVTVPNPNAMKFALENILLTKGGYEFTSKESAEGISPLAVKLFGFDYVDRVYIAKNFVTVNKKGENPSWDGILIDLRIVIKKHLEDSLPVIIMQEVAEIPALTDPIAQQIRAAIEDQIMPATWEDGGEITFSSFEDGVVKVKLAGACMNCPFGPRTVKKGVEVLLKQIFPEVKEVTSDDVNWSDTQL